MQKNRSIEANLQAAKIAIQGMIRYWHEWKEAYSTETKMEAIAAYAAAFTSCKVYLENYLKHLYPSEFKIPLKIAHDIRKIVSEMDIIEKANEKKLHQAIDDIEKLSRDAA